MHFAGLTLILCPVGFVLQQRVVLTHLSPGALDSLLRRILQTANLVVRLERTVLAMLSCKRLGSTLHAFAAHTMKVPLFQPSAFISQCHISFSVSQLGLLSLSVSGSCMIPACHLILQPD